MSQSDAVKKLNEAFNIIQDVLKSEMCKYCKEELELVAKGLESAIMKQTRLGQLVEEMQAKGILDVDEKLRERFGVKESDDLGTSEIFSDLADLIDDFRELRGVVSTVAELSPFRVLPSLAPFKLPRPPLPHELLFGEK